jgi:hypothetical protein
MKSCIRFLNVCDERVLIILINVIHSDLMYSYDEDSTAHHDRFSHCSRSVIICLKSRLYRYRLSLYFNVVALKSSHVSYLFYDLLHDDEKILVWYFLEFLFFAFVNDEDDNIAMTQLRLRRCRDFSCFEKLSCFVFCLEERSAELQHRCRVARESDFNNDSLFQTMKWRLNEFELLM